MNITPNDQWVVRQLSKALDAEPQPRSLESYREEMRKMAFDLACKVDMLARGLVAGAPSDSAGVISWQLDYEALSARMCALYKEAGALYPGEFI